MTNNICLDIICPTIEELSSICNAVKCTEAGCSATFTSSSNLTMHLIKHHQHSTIQKKSSDTRYQCPIDSCPYHTSGSKCFHKLKYLKQHYLKVHAAKTIKCSKCDKCFPTESTMKLHLKNCGITYICSCGWTYTSNEAILTHCKRKGHTILRKVSSDAPEEVTEKINSVDICKSEKHITIYPKLSVPYIAAVALIELSTTSILKAVDKEIQTEHKEVETRTRKQEKKRKNSQQTQTISKTKKMKISTETQTNCEYTKKKCQPRKRKKSMETQTNKRVKIKKFRKLNFEDEKLTAKTVIEDTSNSRLEGPEKWLKSETNFTGIGSNLFTLSNKNIQENQEINLFQKQKLDNIFVDHNIFDLNKVSTIETQTELNTSFLDCDDDTSFTLCSTTETQTTDDFDSLLYSNMCTQTCDDVDSLFNFNFVDIETQTAWPDLDECEYLSS